MRQHAIHQHHQVGTSCKFPVVVSSTGRDNRIANSPIPALTARRSDSEHSISLAKRRIRGGPFTQSRTVTITALVPCRYVAYFWLGLPSTRRVVLRVPLVPHPVLDTARQGGKPCCARRRLSPARNPPEMRFPRFLQAPPGPPGSPPGRPRSTVCPGPGLAVFVAAAGSEWFWQTKSRQIWLPP